MRKTIMPVETPGARGGSSGYVEPFNAWTEDPMAAEVEVVRADVVRLVVPGKWKLSPLS
jgi:hypothetical protein